MSTAPLPGYEGFPVVPGLEDVPKPPLSLVETAGKHDRQQVAENIKLLDVELVLPNRTGYRLSEVTARQMTQTVGKIFAEEIGALEILGAGNQAEAEELAYVFENCDSHGAFCQLLDDFAESTGITLELHQASRVKKDYRGYSANIYQLYSPEVRTAINAIGSGSLPENLAAVMQQDLASKYHFADYVIGLRDEDKLRGLL